METSEDNHDYRNSHMQSGSNYDSNLARCSLGGVVIVVRAN